MFGVGASPPDPASRRGDCIDWLENHPTATADLYLFLHLLM